MSRKFAISIETLSGAPAQVSGELSDSDAAVLERYVKHAEELFATKPIRNGLPCELSISFNPEIRGGTMEAHLPDDDALAVVLHRLRPLILQREAASFINACAVLGKQLAEPNVRAVIRQKRDLFENSDRAQTWAFSANDVRVNAENVLQDWLNGLEYHTDEDRRGRIEQLLAGPEVLVRHALVSMLLNKIDAIEAIRALTRVVLGTLPAVRFNAD